MSMSGALAAMNPEAAAIQRRRALADRLMTQATQQDFRHPLSIGATIAQSLAGALTGYRADQDEEARSTRQREERQAILAPLMAAMGGGDGGSAPAPAMAASSPSAPPQNGGNDFLARLIQDESGGRPDARNPRSTATGAAQFIDGTWMRFAQANPDRFQGMGRDQILAARNDPNLSREAADWYRRENLAALAAQGLPANDGTAGLAHRFGAGGAASLLRADPSAPIAGIVGQQVMTANPDLANRTAGDVVQRYAQRFGGGSPAPQQTAAPQQQRPDQSAAMRGLILQAAMSDDPALQRLAPMLAQMGQRDQPNPVTVAPGATLFDPRTRQPIFTAPERPQRSEPPSGYRFAADGRLEAIPGGPADSSRGGGPFSGSGMDAQANNIALRLAPRIRDGSATPEEQMIYQRAYTHLSGRTLQFITDPTDPAGTRQIGVRVPGDTGDLPPPPSMGAQPAPAGGGAAATVPASGGQNDAAAAPAVPGAIPGLERVTPPPAGFRRTADGSTLEAIPGGPQDQTRQPLTETAARSNMFGQAMQNAEDILGQIRVPSNTAIIAWRNAPEAAVNMALPENDQRYFNALRQFAAGILRKETGAAFTAQELLDVQSRFFPMPGDSPTVQAQKAQARRIAIEAMRAEVPGGFRGLPQTTGPGGQGTAEPPSRVIQYDARGRRVQ
jgi:hypothetical protein